MICHECGGEMSKKWHPKRAGEVETDCVVVWACSLCGSQLTRGAMKLAAKHRQKPTTSINSVPTDAIPAPTLASGLRPRAVGEQTGIQGAWNVLKDSEN